MAEKTEAQYIDDILQLYGGWKADVLSAVRQAITETDPNITEAVKWRMATRPEGLPVWSCSGIVCLAETFKNDIKLVFRKGAVMKDSDHVFNARLQSKTDRAIAFQEGDSVPREAIQRLVREGIRLNSERQK